MKPIPALLFTSLILILVFCTIAVHTSDRTPSPTPASSSTDSAVTSAHLHELSLHSIRLTTCAVLIDDYHSYSTHAPIETDRFRVCQDFLASNGVTREQQEELVVQYRQRDSAAR